ncbi:MAG: hypothetical protein HKM92_09665 [Arenibacter sp.]|nr:hypothetical protein [Arenibacter sp.]
MEFVLKTILNAPAKEIYIAWLSSEGHSNMTGGEATASDKVGAAFTAWDGYIHGTNLVLEKDARIAQSWRTSQFLENENDSQIEILLKETDGVTELTLIHTGLPESGEHYRNGWDVHYFQPMKEYFERNIH